MGGLVDALLRRATRSGFRRGLAGEHWAWLVIAVAAYALRRARRTEESAARLRLRPGDRYLVTLLAAGAHPDAGGEAGGAKDPDGPRHTAG